MKPTQICEVLNRFLLDGFASDIFQAYQTHKIDVHGDRIKLVPVEDLGMISSGGISVGEYIDILDRGAYSAVFMDGSIIYIQATFNGHSIDSHRYFFIPCPFYEKATMSKPSHFTLADWLRDSVELEGVEAFRSVGTYRFDCVRELPKDTSVPHPISHMTFGSADCRIPVKGPLSISYFMHFIFDNFFRPQRPFWLGYSSYLNSGDTEITITNLEIQQHHLNWEEEGV